MQIKRNLSRKFRGRAVGLVFLTLLTGGTAIASGWAPFTRDDSATVVRGGVVSVLDNGATSVLANDFDIERDPMIAILTEVPEEGQVTLNSNGTFEYRHGGSFDDDDDEFRYVAFDGTGFSRETRVRIEILPGDPIAPIITGQRNVRVDEDDSEEIQLRDLEVEDPDSNFPRDFTLEVFDGENYTRVAFEIFPAANFNGDLTVPVRVFDGVNFSNTFDLRVEVRPVNDPPVVTGGPQGVQEAIANQPFSLSLAQYFSDIDEGDSLTFSTSGLPGDGSLSINPNTGLVSGMPTDTDARETPYDVQVTATDESGANASLNFDLIVYPDDRSDLKVTAGVSLNPATVGETVTWNIDVENLGPADVEEGELTAQWMTSGADLSLTAPAGCTVSNNDTNSPIVRCNLNGLPASQTSSLSVQGSQNADGDYSLVAVAVADDPILDNNTSLIGAQVVSLFSEGPTQILDVGAGDLASDDLNGDGLYDVVAISPDEALVYFNDGNRALTTPGQSLGVDSGGSAVTLLDWNNDGAMDVAIASDNEARIFLNDGTGAFGEGLAMSPGNVGAVYSLAAADFDLDGDDDLVVAGSNEVALLHSNGDDNPGLSSLPGAGGLDVLTTDLNNDTFTDIVIVDVSDRSVRLLDNSGDGLNFGTQSLARGSVAGVTAKDLNEDGNMDLLLAVDGDDLQLPSSLVLMQQSDGSFADGASIGASPISKLVSGDVDGDQVNDIVAINEGGVHQIYLGQAGGGFALNEEQIVSDGMRRAVLIDFNNDTSLDLILGGELASVLELHANNGIGRLGLGDRVSPQIALVGESSISLAAGDEYVEEGATASDDIDGDLTSAIVINSNVNTSVVGTYSVNYSVQDKAGNQGTVVRSVQVGVNQGRGGAGGGSWSVTMLLLLISLGALSIARNARTNGRFRRTRRF